MFFGFEVLIIEIIGSFYVAVAAAFVRRHIKSILMVIVAVVAGILMYFESQVIAISV